MPVHPDLSPIIAAYGLEEEAGDTLPYGTGLIHRTWKVSGRKQDFILQKVNDKVFRQPELIAQNIDSLGAWLEEHSPAYHFVKPLRTVTGESLLHREGEGYFRLVPFVRDSHTYDVVQDPHHAYEAARQFGKFTRMLARFPVHNLHTTLPDFHNLSIRYRQFEKALSEGETGRVQEAEAQIGMIRSLDSILAQYEEILRDPGFRIRVTHHDSKISNVLFDSHNKGLCVIDLDTVMPGYFISDLGDMIRTYISPVGEDEKDLGRITIREEYFTALVRGYLEEMKGELSLAEGASVVFAGKFMIYMQAIRFLTDHFLLDPYYGARYEGHNFIRACNQLTLLQHLLDKEERLMTLVTF